MAEWYTLPTQSVLVELQSDDQKGLTATEVKNRLSKYGPNELQDRGVKSPFAILLEQLSETLVVILIIAAVVSALLGEFIDAIAIGVIVVLNAILGVTQEYRAEKAMAALKKMSVAAVKVIRDGMVREVAATQLVPGDCLILEAGNIVPADCRLIETSLLRIQEAALTGESEAVEKQSDPLQNTNITIGDRINMAYMGTNVTNGRGKAIITGTGMNTELGKIAAMIQHVEREDTPLQKRLDKLGKNLAAIAFVLVAIVFAVGMSTGQDLKTFLNSYSGHFGGSLWDLIKGHDVRLMFLTAVSLAVAAVPEGLPAVVTIALALGARRMLKRKALIRKLPAVETLGSVTAICSDKTGTLTENRMTVTILDVAGHHVDLGMSGIQNTYEIPENHPALALLLAGSALCNDAVLHKAEDTKDGYKAIGDPTENALLIAATKYGYFKKDLDMMMPRVAEIPFDSDRKRMTTVHSYPTVFKDPGDPLNQVFTGILGDGSFRSITMTKGAVDSLLNVSSHVLIENTILELDSKWRETLTETNNRLAANGMRVLGLACKPLPHVPDRNNPGNLESGLIFTGMTAMIDPPRVEVKDAVAVCKKAGIRPYMITGDHPLTASYIADELGIKSGGRVITGQTLEKISQDDLDKEIDEVTVFARVSPEHKLKIVGSLQKKGHIVAMTGDGVNDAPALKKADIGVAMGITGTDVSKEASDMVLLDDNFATIVSAVSEGRVIYDNIKKFINYLMSSNCGEIWVMLLGPLFGMPLALLPLQILWINLVTDGLPALALGIEKAEKDTMSRPPHRANDNIFGNGMGIHILFIGLLMGLVPLLAGYYYWHEGSHHWQTVVFTVLTLSQLGNAMAIRSTKDSFFTIGPFSNMAMIGAVGLTFILQLIVLYTPFLREVFNLDFLGPVDLGICILLSTIVFWAVEIEKWILRKANKRIG